MSKKDEIQDPLEWFPFMVDMWLGSQTVALMTLAARGAYVQLMCYQWRDGSIPAEEPKIARLLGLPLVELHQLWEELGPAFPECGEGRRMNPRLSQIRVQQTERHAKAVTRATNAANARWKGREDAPALTVVDGDASGNAPSIPQAFRVESQEDKGVNTAAGAKKESRAAMLFRLLPDSHRTPAMQEAIGAYFKMRAASKMRTLIDDTIESRAKEYGQYAPEAVIAALAQSTREQWQSVHPDKHGKRTGPSATSAKVVGLSDAEIAAVSR
jgi:hypothetical protein